MIYMAKKGLCGLIAGLGLGVGLGVLFAPEKGSVTRKKLKEKLDDVVKEVKNMDKEDVKILIDELRNNGYEA